MLTKLQKYIVFFGLFGFFFSLISREVYAVCPVCTVAVGAGLGISRALGIDDAVTSVWIGGLVLSMSYWMLDWFDKKNFKFLRKWSNDKQKPYFELFVIFSMYALVLIPLWYGKFIGRISNQLWGIDKILFGTIVGSFFFLFGKWADKKVRKIKGKQLFVYQKVVFPVISLLISSFILHLITG